MRQEKRRGQVVVIVGLVLALLILSISVTLFSVNNQYEQLQQGNFYGTISNIRADLTKTLGFILANTTRTFNQTSNFGLPRNQSLRAFANWTQAARTVFAASGVQLNFSLDKVKLQGPEKYQPALTVGNLSKVFWYEPQSVSAIEASYSVSLRSQGFYGWSEKVLVLLNVTMLPNTIRVSSNGRFSVFNVLVNRENGIPVDNLNPSNFHISFYTTAATKPGWTKGYIDHLVDTGKGNYSIFFNDNPNTKKGSPVPFPYNQYLLLWVTDTRGILAESYTYQSASYIVDENAITRFHPNLAKPKEIYSLEAISNGSIIWFNHLLQFNSTVNQIPLPIPPVKQLRVSVSKTCCASPVKLSQTPSQVEIWDSQYHTPTKQFAASNTRFTLGDKLVFALNFSQPGIYQQAVQITWLSDADAVPPNFLIKATFKPGKVIVNNGMYKLGLIASNSQSLFIDYNLQVNDTKDLHHVEYTLFGYDAACTGGCGGAVWLPAKLPWGSFVFNPKGPFHWNSNCCYDNNQSWVFASGPVRAVAFRQSDWTFEPPLNSSGLNPAAYWCNTTEPGCPAGANAPELQHTEIILVPFGVPYFETFVSANPISGGKIAMTNQYLSLMGMISGVNCQGNPTCLKSQGSEPNGLNYTSAQLVTCCPYAFDISTPIVNGTYSLTSPGDHISRGDPLVQLTATKIGWWLSMYGANGVGTPVPLRGQAIFLDDQTVNALLSSSKKGYWIQSSFDKLRRIAEFDFAFYSGGTAYTLDCSKVTCPITYQFGGWFYGGGTQAGSCATNTPIWDNGKSCNNRVSPDNSFINETNTYYLMFDNPLTVNKPSNPLCDLPNSHNPGYTGCYPSLCALGLQSTGMWQSCNSKSKPISFSAPAFPSSPSTDQPSPLSSMSKDFGKLAAEFGDQIYRSLVSIGSSLQFLVRDIWKGFLSDVGTLDA
jgi:hypothetical protein